MILFAAGSAIWGFEQPQRDAEVAEIVSFYEETSTEILIGGTMSIVSVIFLVWFGAVLRGWLTQAEGAERSGLPLVAFGGAVLTAAVGLGAETINMAGAMRSEDGELTAGTAQVYFDVSFMFGYPAAGVAIAAMAAPLAMIAVRERLVLLSSLSWLAVAVALVMVIPPISLVGPLYAVLLVLGGTLSVWIYRQPAGPARPAEQR
ncbi:MAG: hypothetical protein ACRDKV_01450 [Solirubrobacterales bacterium]